MSEKALLALEDGTVLQGWALGARVDSYGEVVFTTAMTGYEETITDPSYAGQIVVFTYPLIGNYGLNLQDVESRGVQVRGAVVREHCETPSHWRSVCTLDRYLGDNGVPGISGLDTRALTRRLRAGGVRMGLLSSSASTDELLARLKTVPRYDDTDFVREVSTPSAYYWQDGPVPCDRSLAGIVEGKPHIVVLDCGLKYSILRNLADLGCRLTAVPSTYSAEDVLALEPDGVVLSPGPGNPSNLLYIEATVRALIGVMPLMGICLGHQLIGRALGASTYKLKFGHHGANHPVLDMETKRVYITAQNHGYALDPDSLKGGLEVSHVNINDNTVEGLRHRDIPLLSIQYHSEASPGPLDNRYLFERFVDMVRSAA
ncbi:MAG: glutamine-hydrolyzing carbamoyl-phosphate synthase small subunit [Chloroflexota bacterium]